MSPFGLLKAVAVAAVLTSASAADLHSQSPPESLEAAVSAVLASLSASQKSIVKGTAKESLFMLLPEWGEDIEERLSLRTKGSRLVATVCARACLPAEAALVIMEAVWKELQQ